MRWEDFRQSDNIEDRRGDSGGGGFAIPGGGGGGLGLGAIVILTLIGWATGINPAILIGGAEMVSGGSHSPQVQTQQASPSRPGPAPSDQIGRFVSGVVGNVEDTWTEVLPAQKGIKFTPAPLVLFSSATTSGCGRAESAMGPFYCPVDRKMYLDTAFFQLMQKRFGGGGDFAYAYVIAHEMGHHIENLLGILPKVQRAQQQAGSQSESNGLSVRVELMADCLAGVWAANSNKKKQFIEAGDVEKAVGTAQAIGDDILQRGAGRNPNQETFTHGAAAQRVQWLKTGLQSGQVDSCNTFAR